MAKALSLGHQPHRLACRTERPKHPGRWRSGEPWRPDEVPVDVRTYTKTKPAPIPVMLTSAYPSPRC